MPGVSPNNKFVSKLEELGGSAGTRPYERRWDGRKINTNAFVVT